MPQRDDLPFINLQEWDNRIRVALSCRDCDDLPRVPGAGSFAKNNDVDVQIMHNGIQVLKDGYIGPHQSLAIQLLRGVHEPQEERVFAEILPYMPASAVMVELGCWWAYYSLWFNKSVPDARNYCVEPDFNNLQTGIHNFLLNGAQATFMHAGVPLSEETQSPIGLKTKGGSIVLPLDGLVTDSRFEALPDFRRLIPAITVDSFMEDQQLDFIDLLHVDIQLAEHHLLLSSKKSFEQKRVGYIFVSTHGGWGSWWTQNYDKYHYECLRILKEVYGYHIVAEHSLTDSYSGDGLIVAKIPGHPGPDHVEVSKRSLSDFPEKPNPNFYG